MQAWKHSDGILSFWYFFLHAYHYFILCFFLLKRYKPILCWLCPKTDPNAIWSFWFSVGFVLRTDEHSEPKNDANTFALDKGVFVFSVKILMLFISRGKNKAFPLYILMIYFIYLFIYFYFNTLIPFWSGNSSKYFIIL